MRSGRRRSSEESELRNRGGLHHCAGAHLFHRTVGAILRPMRFERFPNMTLPDPASVRWHGFGFRGPLNLPVRLQEKQRAGDRTAAR